MTTESFTPLAAYTIAGTGPYAVTWPYGGKADISAWVGTSLAALSKLNMATWSISPTNEATGGNLTLTAETAATHAGKLLVIDRMTELEQGWAGTQSAREAGLERQIDRNTRHGQDLAELLRRAAKLPPGTSQSNPALPVPVQGQALVGRADLTGWENGPDPLGLIRQTPAWDAGTGAFPSGAKVNWTWAIGTAGTIDGVALAEGDMITALVDGAATDDADDWFVWPGSAVLPRVYGSIPALLTSAEPARGAGTILFPGGLMMRETASGEGIWSTSNQDGYTAINPTTGVKYLAYPIGGTVYASQFGVVFDWDGASGTDNTDTLNRALSFARTERCRLVIDGTDLYCAGTIFWGGAFVSGLGAPTNEANGVSRSRTAIFSDGNPAHSSAGSETGAQTFFLSQMENILWVAAGGPVDPVDLWDYEDYPYQVGGWLGRNPLYMQTITGGEVAVSGGAGGIFMRNVVHEAFTGWGLYGYKLWGKSVLENLFFRNCGGGAEELVDAASIDAEIRKAHLSCGDMAFASLCVDFIARDVHGFTDNNHGCGLKLGADEDDTDALDRLFSAGGYQGFQNIHIERRKYPLAAIATGGVVFNHCAWSGPPTGDPLGYGIVEYGDVAKTVADRTMQSYGTKYWDVSRVICAGPMDLDIGQTNNDAGLPTIEYYADLRCKSASRPVSFSPMGDALSLGATSGGVFFLPFLRDEHDTSPLATGLIGPLANGTAGSLLWTWNSVGEALVIQPYEVRLKNGAEIYDEITGLTPGDIYTVYLYFRVTGNVPGNKISFGVTDGSGVSLFARAMGADVTNLEQTDHIRQFNIAVPADGTLRIYAANAGSNNALYFRHPIVSKGFGPKMGTGLDQWPTSAGIVAIRGAYP